jgi:hypothetical protein
VGNLEGATQDEARDAWANREGITWWPGARNAELARRPCAVLLDASALLADPHSYVGGFQGLVYDGRQIVPD